MPKIEQSQIRIRRIRQPTTQHKHVGARMDRFRELLAIHLARLEDDEAKRHKFLTRAFEALAIRRQMQLEMDPVECTEPFALLSLGRVCNEEEEEGDADNSAHELLRFSRAMRMTRKSDENKELGLTLESDLQVETFVNQAVMLIFFKGKKTEQELCDLYVKALTLLHETLKKDKGKELQQAVVRPVARMGKASDIADTLLLLTQACEQGSDWKRAKHVHFVPGAFDIVHGK